ncbi:Pc21g05000 [Penicillium rubens Wisconsin 54-1255]|uniref:Pc21g05000 protein n=2 Tax=Penicillium chrysogenum species complex TaxID=254878 RepID=B6HN70_PENRW|nr:Pc21g05000 [Penicillium rubens Wisconsin 54-1255]
MGPPPQHTVRENRSDSDTSNASLKSPRTARFAEATSIHSPIGCTEAGRSPFADPPNPQARGDVGDVGFGYVAANNEHANDQVPMSPFRPDLKVPQTAKSLNPLSPTFREEYMLEKQEKKAEVENARDLKIKLRVRIAKVFLRFVNFGCSLIVLSLIAVTLTVFNATRHLPTRNNLPAWAGGTNPWAQYLLLSMACVSLVACLFVFWAYRKGGHGRAEKAAVYYTSFSLVFFGLNLIMWIVGAAVYQHSKATGNGKDMWGWSCAKNTREQLYHNTVDYALLCRLQDWGLVCAIIEIVIEVLVILIYAVVFYRVWSKRKLMKSMDTRDNARSDLYLAQLRLQSAPNTPGFAGFTSYPPKSPFYAAGPVDPHSAAEKGMAQPQTTQYASPRSPTRPTPSFQLQPPPIKVQQPTPQTAQEEFAPPSHHSQSPPPQSQRESPPMNRGSAPGERTYDAVPIPGAYQSPMVPVFPAPVRK